jgi:hypothetical protein
MLNVAFLAGALGGNVRSLVTNKAAMTGDVKDLQGKYVPYHESVTRHVKHLYEQAKGRHPLLLREDFAAYIKKKQGVDISDLLTQDEYNLQQFFWIWSSNPSIWDAVGRSRQDDVDTSRPLSHYFISSSHNTYLTGNQLTSDSSARAYRAALKNGCRCIEIDVWDGPTSRTPSRSPKPGHRKQFSSASIPRVGEKLDVLMSGRSSRHSRSPSAHQTSFPAPDPRESNSSLDPKELTDRLERSKESPRPTFSGEPVVHHHGTMTSTVKFRDVCRVIRETAFETNPLPIIVSLEVGASREQQELMVQIMKEEWGDLLLDKPLEGCDPRERQPKLEELYYKILIKVKRLEDKCKVVDDAKVKGEAVDVDRGRSRGIAIRAKPPICESLAALAIYTHSEHYDDVDSLNSKTPSHIFSLSEESFSELTKYPSKFQRLLAHNRDFFMRIYPSPMRVNSSNPDPTIHWRRGVQMVAMNWQKTDEGMMLNDAMFAGTNGWVLKPPELLSDKPTGGSHRVNMDLKIKVLAGQFLPRGDKDSDSENGGVVARGDKKFRPRVKVELHVEKAHNKEKEYVRWTSRSSTEHPDWGVYVPNLKFNCVQDVVEELSFVRLVAMLF